MEKTFKRGDKFKLNTTLTYLNHKPDVVYTVKSTDGYGCVTSVETGLSIHSSWLEKVPSERRLVIWKGNGHTHEVMAEETVLRLDNAEKVVKEDVFEITEREFQIMMLVPEYYKMAYAQRVEFVKKLREILK